MPTDGAPGYGNRRLIILCFLVVAGAGIIFLLASARPNANDYLAYWSAARQLLQHKNPYSSEQILLIEQRLELVSNAPLVLRNPPWTIPLLLPFGLLPFTIAQKLWMAVNLAAMLVSIVCLSRIFEPRKRWAWQAHLCVAVFSPVAAVFAVGQITSLVLLGVVAFLWFERRNQFALAGACLALAAIKPHLIFLLWPTLLFWAIRKNVVRAIASFSLALTLASAVALRLDPAIFKQYFAMLSSEGVLSELTPTLAGTMKLLTRSYASESTLALFALVWVLYYWHRQKQWEWKREMPKLLLVSLMTSPYSWLFDQVVLLPCIFQAVAWLHSSPRSLRVWILAIYIGANLAVFALIFAHRSGFWYAWTPAFWMLMYFTAGGMGTGERHDRVERS